MTSGTSADEFKVTPEQERAFQELLRGARELRGWSQQEMAYESERLGYPIKQTLISSLERCPYPGMRVWDIYKLCRVYGIPVSQVLTALGWNSEQPESQAERRMGLILSAVRDLAEKDVDTILSVVERYIVGVRHAQE